MDCEYYSLDKFPRMREIFRSQPNRPSQRIKRRTKIDNSTVNIYEIPAIIIIIIAIIIISQPPRCVFFMGNYFWALIRIFWPILSISLPHCWCVACGGWPPSSFPPYLLNVIERCCTFIESLVICCAKGALQ